MYVVFFCGLLREIEGVFSTRHELIAKIIGISITINNRFCLLACVETRSDHFGQFKQLNCSKQCYKVKQLECI